MSALIFRMMRGVSRPALSTGKKGRAGIRFVPSWWYGAYFIGEPTTTASVPLSRQRIDCRRLPLLISSGCVAFVSLRGAHVEGRSEAVGTPASHRMQHAARSP